MENSETSIVLTVAGIKRIMTKDQCRQVEFRISAADETKYLVTEVITGGIRARCIAVGKDGISVTITDSTSICVTHLPKNKGEG